MGREVVRVLPIIRISGLLLVDPRPRFRFGLKSGR